MILTGCTSAPSSGSLLSYARTDFQNISINGTVSRGTEKLPNFTIENYRCPADSYMIRYENNYLGQANNDYWVLRKCDGNDAIPDGGIAMEMCNTTACWSVFDMQGKGNLNLSNLSKHGRSKAVCVRPDGALGLCHNAVNVTGGCNCT